MVTKSTEPGSKSGKGTDANGAKEGAQETVVQKAAGGEESLIDIGLRDIVVDVHLDPSPAQEISASFQQAFLDYAQMSEKEFVEEAKEALAKSIAEKGPNFLNLEFEQLFDVELQEGGSDAMRIVNNGSEGGVNSLERFLSIKNVFSVSDEDELYKVESQPQTLAFNTAPAYPYSIPPTQSPDLRPDGPRAPPLDIPPPSNENINITETALNTQPFVLIQSNIFLPTIFNNFQAASVGSGLQSMDVFFNFPARAGSSEVHTSNLTTLTTPEGNVFIFDRITGDYSYQLNNAVLHLQSVWGSNYVDALQEVFTDRFVYSITDTNNQTAVGAISVFILDGVPLATDQSTVAISEADIKTVGSNLSPTAEQLPGSLVFSPNNIFGADGGTVSNVVLTSATSNGVTNATGNTVISLGTITITDSEGNTFVIDQATGSFAYNLNNAYTNINHQPTVLVFTFTFTDADQDSITKTITITINDDNPVGTVILTGAIVATDETPGKQSGVETAVPAGALGQTTVLHATLVNDTTIYGADGAGSRTYTLNVVDGTASGFKTPDGSQDIVLVKNGAVVEGHVGTTGGALAFTVSVNANGDVTLTQYLAIQHTPDSGANQLSNGMTPGVLTLTEKVTDSDGDSITPTVDLGTVIKFYDDAPTGTISLNSGVFVVTDETPGIQSPESSATGFLGQTTVAYSLLITDTTIPGSDGLHSKVYSLVAVDGTASGYKTPDGLTNIVLFNNGGDVEGHVGTTGGALAFVVHVDSSTGAVTLTQYLAVQHTPNSGADQESTGMTAGVLQIRATVTDKDGDVINPTTELGTAIRFRDDAPTGTLSLNSGVFVVTDETPGVQSPESSATGFLGQTTVTYASLITDTTIAGSDGLASKVYSLVAVNGTASGYKTPDGLTNIVLFNNGGDIEGHVGTTGGALAFKVHVDSSTGDVTLTQYLAVQHTPDSGADQESTGMTAGVLQIRATVTDKDGDVINPTTELGTAIRFRDDAPTATDINHATVLDEAHLPGGSNPDGSALSTSGTLLNGSGNVFGSDGGKVSAVTITGSTSNIDNGTTITVTTAEGNVLVVNKATGAYTYTLNAPIHEATPSDTQATNVFHYTFTDNDGDQASANLTITIKDDVPIASNITGGTVNEADIPVIGSSADASAPTTSGTLLNGAGNVFGADGGKVSAVTITGSTSNIDNGTTITVTTAEGNVLVVNKATGAYTYTLNAPIDNANPSDTQATNVFHYTFTDNDGDQASANLTITINDDAPLASNITGGTVNEADIPVIGSSADASAPTTSGTLLNGTGNVFGADGGSVSAVTISGSTSNVDNGTTITVTTAEGNILVVNKATGAYTYTLNAPIHEASPSDTQATNVFHYTFTDNDGDQASANLTITINDDVPIATSQSGGTLNEADLPGGSSPDGSALSTSGTLLNGSGNVFGADGGSVSAVTISGSTSNVVTATTITVTTAEGNVLVVDRATGAYTYTLNAPIHEASPSDTQATNVFHYTFTDNDGDQASANLTITINDDVPIASNITGGTVNEADIPVIGSSADASAPTTSGTLLNGSGNVFGADGGSVSAVTITGSTSNVVTATTITVITAEGNVLVVDRATGAYTYTLNAPIHEATPSDTQATNVFHYTFTDNDGDQASANLTIAINDDAPIATSQSGGTLNEANLPGGSSPDGSALTTSGTLLNGSGNVFGADGGSVSAVTISGSTSNVVTATSITVTTAEGNVLVVDRANGAYTYTLNAPITNANPSDTQATNVFHYTFTDNDGDQASANLTITINDDVPTGSIAIPDYAFILVDETPGVQGSVETAPSGTLGEATLPYSTLFTDSTNYGADGAGSKVFSLVAVDGTDSGYKIPDGSQNILLYNVMGGDVEGRIGDSNGAPVFKVHVDSDTGAVTLTQYLAIQHTPNAGADQLSTGMNAGVLLFKATVTDADGDSISPTADLGVKVWFADDGATATNLTPSGDEDAASIQVNLSAVGSDGILNFRVDTLPNVSEGKLYQDAGLTDLLTAGELITASSNAATLYFVPAANYNGNVIFNYVAVDNDGDADTAQVNITVNSVNDAPVASPSSAVGFEDSVIDVNLFATDIDGTISGYKITTLPTDGVLYHSGIPVLLNTLYFGGAFTFEPDLNVNSTNTGPIGLNYVAVDNQGAESAPAHVDITIMPVNDAPEANLASASGNEDSIIPISLTGTDVDGFVANFRIDDLPINGILYKDLGMTQAVGEGELIAASNNSVQLYFMPAQDFNGQVSFQYVAVDNNNLDSASAQANVTVESVNDAPVASPSSAVGFEDSVIDVNLFATDIDGTISGYKITTLPTDGVLYHSGIPVLLNTLYFGGAFTFEPDLNVNSTNTGPIGLNYVAVDNQGAESAPAHVDITIMPVNDDPIANNDTYTTFRVLPSSSNGFTESNSVNANAANGLLMNDTDIDGDALTVIGVTGSTGTGSGPFSLTTAYGGNIIVYANGAFNYTKTGSGFVTDSFQYTISDGHGGTSTATAYINAQGVTQNAAPVAFSDSGAGYEDAANPITGNVLSNDQDVDTSSTLFSVLDPGTFDGEYGTLILNLDGSYSYQINNENEVVNALNVGNELTDNFFYSMTDNNPTDPKNSQIATLAITIHGANDAPEAVADIYTGGDVTSGVFITTDSPMVANLLDNDTDVDDPHNTLSITSLIVNGDSKAIEQTIELYNDNSGTVTNIIVHADGTFTYSGAYNHSDTLEYVVEDGHGGQSTASITLTIPAQETAPVILDLNNNNKIDLISSDRSEVTLNSFEDTHGTNHMGWVKPEDGILVYDYQGDGKVTNIDEIALTLHSDAAKTDLDALRILFDSNHDGVFDAKDEKFDKFGVWQDKNSDGLSDAGEYKTLTQMGIISINVNSDHQVQMIEGNTVHGFTSYTTADGVSHVAGDVALNVAPATKSVALESHDVIGEHAAIDFSNVASLPPLASDNNSVVSLTAQNAVVVVENHEAAAPSPVAVTQQIEQQHQETPLS